MLKKKISVLLEGPGFEGTLSPLFPLTNLFLVIYPCLIISFHGYIPPLLLGSV